MQEEIYQDIITDLLRMLHDLVPHVPQEKINSVKAAVDKATEQLSAVRHAKEQLARKLHEIYVR